MGLSKEAIEILEKATRENLAEGTDDMDDFDNTIHFAEFDGLPGLFINGENLIKSASRRQAEPWKRGMEQLLERNLIDYVQSSEDIYVPTPTGFEVGDLIRKGLL